MHILFASTSQDVRSRVSSFGIPKLLLGENSETLVSLVMSAGTPGALILSPDFIAATDFPQLSVLANLVSENNWKIIAFVEDMTSDEPERLYNIGCCDVVHWRESPGELEQSFNEVIKRLNLRDIDNLARNVDVFTRAGIVPWEWDVENWRYAYIGRSAESILGYPLENFYSKNYATDLLHPDDRSRVQEYWRLVAKEGNGIYELRNRMIGAGGRVVWVRHIISANSNPGSNSTTMHGISIDVTPEVDLLRNEVKNKEREASQLEQYLMRAPIAVLQADSELKVTAWSQGAEAMFGIPQSEAFGHPWHDLGIIHPEDEARVIEELVPLLNGETRYKPITNRNICRDGSIITVQWVNTCLRNSDGTLRSILSMGRDVTAETNALEQKRQIDQMQAIINMSSGLAHDFKNFLSPVLAQAEIIESDQNLPDTMRERGTRIRRNLMRARATIDTLVHANKPLQLCLCQVNTQQFAEEVISFYNDNLPENISLVADYDNAPETFPADDNLLFQVVINLINNARDAIDEQTGQIAFRIFQCKNEEDPILILEVEDNGPGISEEIRSTLFNPFTTTKESGRGTGLGLFMSSRVVEAHGGSIEALTPDASRTVFRITLPLSITEDTTVNGEQAEPGQNYIDHKSGSLRILIVDDEPVVLETTQLMLEFIGCHCTAFQNAEKAKEHILEHADEYDLILTDYMMEEMNGADLAQQIREAGVETPITLLTGTEPGALADLIADGTITAGLNKPVTLQELESHVFQFKRMKPTPTE